MYGGILCFIKLYITIFFLEIVIQEKIKCLRLKRAERLPKDLKKQDQGNINLENPTPVIY